MKVAKSYLKLRLKQTNKFKNKQKDLKSYEGGHPLKSDCKSKSSKYPKVIWGCLFVSFQGEDDFITDKH